MPIRKVPIEKITEILRLRSEQKMIYDDIGIKFGITRERVRQICCEHGLTERYYIPCDKCGEENSPTRMCGKTRFCRQCRRERQKNYFDLKAGKRWTVKFKRCCVCGQTEYKHARHGICVRCSQKYYYNLPNNAEYRKKRATYSKKHYLLHKERCLETMRKYRLRKKID